MGGARWWYFQTQHILATVNQVIMSRDSWFYRYSGAAASRSPQSTYYVRGVTAVCLYMYAVWRPCHLQVIHSVTHEQALLEASIESFYTSSLTAVVITQSTKWTCLSVVHFAKFVYCTVSMDHRPKTTCIVHR